MKNVHLFTVDDHDKFMSSYIDFIDRKFDSREHIFIKISSGPVSILELVSKIKLLYNKKIFVHGLNSGFLCLALLIQPWVLSRTYWVIWGGDLHFYERRNQNINNKIVYLLKRSAISRMRGLITQLKGDYELAQKWYGAKGKHYYSFVYPSNLYKEYDLKEVEQDFGKIYIQIGNSACETNEHIEIFGKLSKYKDENIEVICPLSYSGKENYIKQVIESGYEIFGKEKFVPITNFMPFDEYLELLAKVDIAIFNHKRQRGLGNITTLLGLGKKVYIREEISTWNFCIDHDLKVYNASGNFDDLFEKIDDEIKQHNIKNIKTKFSEEKLVEDLKEIFDEGIK